MSYLQNFQKKIEAFNSNGLSIFLNVECRGTPPNTVCIRLEGDLEGENSQPLTELLRHLFDEPMVLATVVVDCGKLHYVSSTGIGTLVFFLLECNKRNIQLQLGNVPEHKREIFKLLGYSSYFTFVDSPYPEV